MCTKYILEIFKKQETGGHVVMVDGVGSDHFRVMEGFSSLGAAKSGLSYLTRSIVKEIKHKYPNIGIHRVQPGPVNN